jgi:glycosyltransferase involved in cell wall biosynthesis
MRSLHVAALPFPSPQGSQGLLHAMLTALGAAGHDTHLACYGHGVGGEPGPYTVHRAPAASFTGSLRSGPSLDKLWLDASLARLLASLHARLAPDLVVAHHVEAALCALALGLPRVVFVAHTSLRSELPSYLPRALAPVVRALGSRCDTLLVRRARHSFAVSPLLAELLAQASGRDVRAVPLPWSVSPPLTPAARLQARARLGLGALDRLLLYAGNLDAYQGLDALVPELARLFAQRPALRWLVATEAPRERLVHAAKTHGFAARLLFTGLQNEAARRDAHAAADLALVPRASAGGLPIKLLDALARAVPVVAAPLALAGLPLEHTCEVVTGVGPGAWVRSIERVLAAPEAARVRAQEARVHIERAHAPSRFVAALMALGASG